MTLFAVVLKHNNNYRYCFNRGQQLLVYYTLGEAVTSAKRFAQRKSTRKYGISLRVIPLSPEGELADIWDDYKHTEVL